MKGQTKRLTQKKLITNNKIYALTYNEASTDNQRNICNYNEQDRCTSKQQFMQTGKYTLKIHMN